MGIPLQQMGRVLALDGSRSESTVLLMDHLLPEENWKMITSHIRLITSSGMMISDAAG